MTRNELRRLATLRLKEATLLLRSNCWEGAYYLSGYAVECALKAGIAKQTSRFEFPDKNRVNSSYTHSLANLLRVASLKDRLDDETARRPELGANWLIVQKWSEESRYERHKRSEAEDLLKALADPTHGIMQWLKEHW